MQIGLVIYGSLDTLSGGYLYDRRVVEYLREQGDRVEIISQPWGSYAARLGRNWFPSLLERLANLKLDCLLQDELNHPSLFDLNRQLRIWVRYPVVSIVHHLRSSELHPAPLRMLYRAVERAYLQTVDGFVYNSQTTRRSVEALLGRDTCGVVAYPGGDQFGSGAVVEKHSHSHNGQMRMLFVGNLIPRKGLHTLLQAAARLPAGGWQLQIVGRGDVDPRYAGEMRRLAAPLGERVRFLGRLEEAAFRRVWQENQVLVVPSSYEGFGIVYLEGMAFGLPAVASTAGAAGEIIRDGENGFLVPPEQPEALARVLAGLISDPGRLAALSASARKTYEQFPTWRQTAAKVRDFLQQFISGRIHQD